MSIGRLEQLFEFKLDGVELSAEAQFHVPTLGLEAQLSPGTPVKLSIQIEGTTKPEAQERADSFVQKLYRRMLLRFGPNIRGSTAPRCISRTFTPLQTSSPSSLAATITGSSTVAAVITALLAPTEIEALVHDVEVRVVTPRLTTSAQLYTSISMYVAGIESQNRVVRFLVFYSALSLAALSRLKDGTQQNVDQLLLERNSGLAVTSSPRNSNVNETLYTKLRNDLIHAENRGRDPAGAIAAIEANISQFQRDVSSVFSNL
jgi:hypothetical protein